MRKNAHLAIIGHFGGKKEYFDGQTVKTKAVYDALKRFGIQSVHKVDTYYIRRNPFRFFGQFVLAIIRDKQFIVLLSKNGRKIIFPILYKLSKIGKKIYHYVIGGQLANEAEENLKSRKQIKSFKANWVESKLIVTRLKKLGVLNASYIPNFKNIRILQKDELSFYNTEPFRFCMFSRVMKEKGIEDAIKAIRQINEESGKTLATLDIYGQIESGYEERFNNSIHQMGAGYSVYRGIIPPDESVECLKNYYMLLFPTFWKGEGMPGTIIDALSSGLPIIARRWKYCDEMIDNNVTGFVYDFEKPNLLNDMIEKAITYPDQVNAMKINCLQKAQEYSVDNVMNEVIRQMHLKD